MSLIKITFSEAKLNLAKTRKARRLARKEAAGTSDRDLNVSKLKTL